MEYPQKEVRFDEFCPKCKFYKLNESEDPCNDCLQNPSNLHSRVPTEFKEADNAKTNAKPNTKSRSGRC